MKRLIIAVFIVMLHLTAFAQKSVTIVVVGEGNTKESATQSALRSAVEQSFGAFVSSNTTILDDELVKDEIVSISSGNIQNYKELSFSRLDDGHCSVSIEATVSLAKLTSFARSKGSECELAGATFAANLQLAKFYSDAENKAIDNLLSELRRMLPSMYDYTINVGNPKPVETRKGLAPTEYDLVFDITLNPNDASRQFYGTFIETLRGLSMNMKTASSFRQITGVSPAELILEHALGNSSKFVLRNAENLYAIQQFVNNELRPSLVSVSVEDNLGGNHKPEIGKLYAPHGIDYPGSVPNGPICREIRSGYEITNIGKETKYNFGFAIRIPMTDISKYRSFSVRKEYTPKGKKVYRDEEYLYWL